MGRRPGRAAGRRRRRYVVWYPIVIHKDPGSNYGVTVPDLPGCFSAGSTTAGAMAMAREAIELHVEGLIEHGEAVPPPSPIERMRAGTDYQDGTWAIVPVDLTSPRATPTA
jgi:predicted RNase H-like HicB family nuclease